MLQSVTENINQNITQNTKTCCRNVYLQVSSAVTKTFALPSKKTASRLQLSLTPFEYMTADIEFFKTFVLKNENNSHKRNQ